VISATVENGRSSISKSSEGRGPLSADVPGQGNQPDLGRIYTQYNRRVYTLCLRMVGDPAEAADLTQEAFIRVFLKLHTFRGESAFSTWLHRVVVNVVLRQFRRKGRRSMLQEEEPLPDEQSDTPCRELGAPDLALLGMLDRLSLERAIAQLPPRYRLVFLLHDVQGYAHCEIARSAGISVGTSKSHLHKARRQMRKLLLSPARPAPRETSVDTYQAAWHPALAKSPFGSSLKGLMLEN